MSMNLNKFINAAAAEGNFLLCKLLREAVFKDDIPAPAATDGSKVFINEDLFSSYSDVEQYGILCHEARHILYQHPKIAKVKELKPSLYNIATDIIINEEVIKAGRKLPDGCLTRELPNGTVVPKHLKSSMSIYEWLLDVLPKETSFDAKDLMEEPSNVDGEIKQLAEIELEKNYSQEARDTKEVIRELKDVKGLSIFDYVKYEVGRLTQPLWKRNFRREGRSVPGCVMPSYRAQVRLPKVKVFIDASGSMNKVIDNIISGLDKVFAKGKMFSARYFLFDTKIEEYRDHDQIGYFLGGTNLNLVADNLTEADMYFVITDCEGNMDRLNNSKQNLVVFTNNKREVYGKAVEVDDEFLHTIQDTRE